MYIFNICSEQIELEGYICIYVYIYIYNRKTVFIFRLKKNDNMLH